MILGYIDEQFKDMRPEVTVKRIKEVLSGLGIEMEEHWNSSGIENCWSLHVGVKGGGPSSNGKGVSKELAQAIAYGEFIERLQSGLFFYKYQSIERDEGMNLHSFAPDAKYMTLQELEENGEWMDYLIQTYGGALTRKKIAQQCKMYACTEEDRILTLPFYSLFEDKYVYLPMGFVEHIYSANGCCAGNTREEAWVHALSEIMERKNDIAMLTSGQAAPQIPDAVLNRFQTVTKIISKIRESGKFDIKVFDFSRGGSFPVVATRIINKETGGYVVNTAADPVLEIAVERTLTEIFQGRNLETFSSKHAGVILNKIDDFPVVHNVLNLLETGNGLFAVDFFAEEISCKEEYTAFPDNSGKNNKELLSSMLEMYRALNKPVYVRNYSFLGFCCYKFIVPGFSESRGLRLNQVPQEYALGDEAAKTLKNPKAAGVAELQMLLLFHKQMKTVFSRHSSFPYLAGLPIKGEGSRILLPITLSYAAYRLNKVQDAIRYLEPIKNKYTNGQTEAYLACVLLYLQMKGSNISDEKIRVVLNKFSTEEHVQRLYRCLESGGTPYDDFLLACDCCSCDTCKYNHECSYMESRELIAKAGQKYKDFRNGQAKTEFEV